MLLELWCVTLLYSLACIVIIFPPDALVSAGLTVEGILASFLGLEMMGFIQYQIKRTSYTIIVYTLLLPGYFMTLLIYAPWVSDYVSSKYFKNLFEIGALISAIPTIISCAYIWTWKQNNWRKHPIAQILDQYASPDTTSPNRWVTVASDINGEFRSIDKFASRVNSISRIIATNNWIMKVSFCTVHIVPLRDAIIVLAELQDTPTLHQSGDVGQYLKIRVSSVRPNIRQFSFKIDSSQWSDLEIKLVNPVVNTHQIVVPRTLADRFATAFLEAVENNAKVQHDQELDSCIGCMQNISNVKLTRQCDGAIRHAPVGPNQASQCVPCSCRPMWCVTCLGKWFAARQDENHPETWLSSRAPCPTCRSPFCLLDVSLIENS